MNTPARHRRIQDLVDALPNPRQPPPPALIQRSRQPAAAPPDRQPRPPAIVVQSLTKHYGGYPAVEALTFTVPRGSITGFIGPNGSGKTTTLRMLLNLAKPTRGHATILGHPLHQPRHYLPKVGALIEGPAFDPDLSGPDNLAVHALLGRFPKARIPNLVRLVGLDQAGKRPYKAYSLGMKQRLGIACALLGNPDLLILDEPTNGLDPAGIRDLRALFAQLRTNGKTLLISSHLLDEMERLCDHVVIIRDGRLIYEGSVQSLTRGTSGLEARVLALTERPA